MDKKTDFKAHLKKKMENLDFAKEFKKEYDKLHLAYEIMMLRQKAGLTQKQLAEKVHTTQSVISRIENPNYQRYSLNLLSRIAEACKAKLEIHFVQNR